MVNENEFLLKPQTSRTEMSEKELETQLILQT